MMDIHLVSSCHLDKQHPTIQDIQQLDIKENMMFRNIALLSTLLAGASAFAPAAKPTTTTFLNSGKTDLEAVAKSLNPAIGYYDPLKLADEEFWDLDNDKTIDFLRNAEIKHGRVAMAAFVGYCVQSNFHWPGTMNLNGDTWPSTTLSPEAQWDSLPIEARYQIIFFVGFLEWWDVICQDDRTKPGEYPSFDGFREEVHALPFDLFDPFNFSKRATEEAKARGRIVEINNGRLAMLGIFGFVSADCVPGSVPLLTDIAIPYAGNIMEPLL